ncbi:MAG: hypothetical protein HC831_24005 [Chloroflexia bacterium]|nr:hypothetical protein [Chloroflexia bacterium]
MMVKIYLIIVSVLFSLLGYSQGIQVKDADPFPRDKNDNQYGFSNETGYIFNTSIDKNVQILGKNYYDTPSIVKKMLLVRLSGKEF